MPAGFQDWATKEAEAPRAETHKAVEHPELPPLTPQALSVPPDSPQNRPSKSRKGRLNGVPKPLAVESQEEATEALVSCGALRFHKACCTGLVSMLTKNP